MSLGKTSVVEIFLGLCYTLFGVTLGLQLGLVTSPIFAWTGGLDEGFVRWVTERRLDFWNILELWYGIALLIFLGSSAVFLSLFTLAYMRTDRREDFFTLFREVCLMIVAALFPFLALHFARLFLSFVPALDPEMSRQLEFMQGLNLSPKAWTFRSSQLPKRAEDLTALSFVYCFAYFLAIEISSNLPVARLVWRVLKKTPSLVTKVVLVLISKARRKIQ